MPINPAIAMGVQPLQLADPLAQYGKIAAIQQAQNQNALAQYQLGAAQREEKAQNALSQAYQAAYDPEKGTYDVNKLRGALITSGVGAKLPEIETKLGALRTQQLAQSKAETELVDSKLKQSRAFLDTVDPTDPNAPEQYIAWYESNRRDPVLGPVLSARGVTPDQFRSRVAQAIQQGPAAFAQLLAQSKLGTEEFMKQNAAKFFQQETGGTTRVLSIPGLGGAATVVPGSEAAKTLTPEQARAAAQERSVVSQTITDAAGNVTLLNKFGQIINPTDAVGAPATIKKELKPEIREVDTNSAIVTQLVDPNTKQITVLGSRPKTLTPEQQRQAAQEGRVVAGSVTDSAGNVTQYNKFGQVIQTTAPAGGGAVQLKGKPSATFERTEAQRKQLSRDLDTAIFELKDAAKEGGLIDQSTGSGVGRAIDVGARMIGKAMPGDIAINKLKPIADIVLKMVPRFEGPQSDKDTQSYKEAAGQLADPSMPTKIRKEAAKTIIRLMENRKGQFVSTDMAAEGTTPGGGVDANNPLLK